MSIVMSEDRATVDVTTFSRNLRAPRTGQSPAEYANPLHAEELERHAKWPERVMLFLAGAFAAALLLVSMLPPAHAGRRDCCGPFPPPKEAAK